MLRFQEVALPLVTGPVMLTLFSLTLGTFEISAEVSFRYCPLYLDKDCCSVRRSFYSHFVTHTTSCISDHTVSLTQCVGAEFGNKPLTPRCCHGCKAISLPEPPLSCFSLPFQVGQTSLLEWQLSVLSPPKLTAMPGL